MGTDEDVEKAVVLLRLVRGEAHPPHPLHSVRMKPSGMPQEEAKEQKKKKRGPPPSPALQRRLLPCDGGLRAWPDDASPL